MPRARDSHEPLRRRMMRLRAHFGLARLGLQASYHWHVDPKRLAITLARYKFVARMLAGRRHVLEIGCGDGFASRLVLQEARRLTVVDLDRAAIADIRHRVDPRWRLKARLHDILEGPVPGRFDGAFAIDLLPHVPRRLERRLMSNICRSLTRESTLILGVPSPLSRRFSSRESRAGHPNIKDHEELRAMLLRYFHTCFLFSANDEVIHTGFFPMAHSLLAVAVGKREGKMN